jgi:menaquinone-dependent protoporphyrinogen IX oxidase
MKTLVVYRSVTGYTRQIAQWIASDLHADVAAADTVGPARLRDYDCVVFGSRLHAVGIDGLSLIKRNWAQLKDKRVLVFATGASPQDRRCSKKSRRKI